MQQCAIMMFTTFRATTDRHVVVAVPKDDFRIQKVATSVALKILVNTV